MNPYLAPQRVRAALRSLGLRPTRGMGQNFLIDQQALQTIVDAAELHRNDTVIEVGPGLGVLTWELLQRAGQVISVELDKRLLARLRDEFSNATNLHLVESDILRITPATILTTTLAQTQNSELTTHNYKLVANLPYAITAPVLRHFLEGDVAPELMVVLVQWEVAERICAKAGDLSVLAHSVQIYAEPEIVARIGANSFEPAPAVDSAILRMRKRPIPAVQVASIDQLFRVIKAGFSQPRKKIANALPGGLAAMGNKMPNEQVLTALERAGIDPSRRAETITLAEWARVYEELQG
jgi:16S rRNA (adenine1518-N6/adenine1519-N6)-dimethyltransferase